MNDKEPEWYGRLKGSPLIGSTFTEEHMNRIVRATWKIGEPRGRNAWIAVGCAFLLSAGILFSVPGRPLDRGIQAIGTALGDPSEQMIQPKALQGALKDQLPFRLEDVQSIRLYNRVMKKTVAAEVPQERMSILLDNLQELDLTRTRVSNKVPLDPDVIFIRLTVDDVTYTIPYDINNNTYRIMGANFYADGEVPLLIRSLLYPGNDYAWIDQALEQAKHEQNEGVKSNAGVREPDSFLVNGKNYNAWNAWLTASEPDPSEGLYFNGYYDSESGAVRRMGVYENERKGRVLLLDRRIVFMDDTSRTPDGIRVGVSPNEVLKDLGEPNVRTPSHWSYWTGDSGTFDLYFEKFEGTNSPYVRFMALTL